MPPGTIEARVIVDVRVIHDGAIDIGVMDDSGVYMRVSRVIAEDAGRPRATHEADACIAETIVDAAIEADVRPPVTRVPGVNSSAKGGHRYSAQ